MRETFPRHNVFFGLTQKIHFDYKYTVGRLHVCTRPLGTHKCTVLATLYDVEYVKN